MSSRSRRRNLHARAYATTQLAGIKCRGQRARVTVEQVTSSFPFLNPLTLNPLTLPFSFFPPFCHFVGKVFTFLALPKQKNFQSSVRS